MVGESRLQIEQAQFIVSAVDKGSFVADGRPEIAFVGRSNVGKSSLLNRLVGQRKLARISSTPGRTRAINYFLLNGRFYFVDLPGYGYAKVSKAERRRWAKLMEQYFDQARSRCLAVQIVDGKVGATELDVQAAEYMAHLGLRRLVVATKMDRLPRSRRHRSLVEIRRVLGAAEAEVIGFSARSGEGSKDLWATIDRYLEELFRRGSEPGV